MDSNAVDDLHSSYTAYHNINLFTLFTAQEDMLRELQSLPVSKDTLRVKQRKEYLEKKLQEIETAIKIFSRPKVFVKDE